MDSDNPPAPLPEVVALAAGLDVVLVSSDEALIQFGTRSMPSELLRDLDLKGLLGRIIGPLLHGSANLGQLLSDIPEEQVSEARMLIADLLNRGIITDPLTSPVEQYLRYTFVGESRLRHQSISLLGVGPIGARLAHSLLQHGIGRVTLVDDRPADDLWQAFAPFGPNQQSSPHLTASVAVRDRLAEAGYSDVELVEAGLDAAGVEAAVARSDFTVLAAEQPDLRLAHLVNRFCIRARKPWLLATVDGNFGLVGPLFLPLHTACYNDYRVLVEAATPSTLIARRHRQHILMRGAGSFFPGLPSYSELVAGYASLAIVHFLLRGTSFALGRVLTLDFDGMLIDVEDVMKLPRCPVCANERSAYEPAFSAEIVTRASTAQVAAQPETPER